MTDSEKKALILSCKTYEEYDKIRGQIHGVHFDRELLDHLDKIFPKASPRRDSKGTILDYFFKEDEYDEYYPKPKDETT